jgi:hypothetical protein
MSRNQSDGSTVEQAAQDTFGAQQPVVRISTVEELVEQEEQWYGTGRDIRKRPDPIA